MTIQPATKASEIVKSFVSFYQRTRVMTTFEYKKIKKEIVSIPSFAERYMLLGMLECHYGNSEECKSNFKKALSLSSSDMICHNYILALEWQGDYDEAIEAANDNLRNIFSAASLENIISLGLLSLDFELIDNVVKKCEALCLPYLSERYKSITDNFLKFKGTSHYCDGDEYAYSRLLIEFFSKYNKLDVNGADISFDEFDEVLNVVFFINEKYEGHGDYYFESQDFFVENVISRELNSRIVVSFLPGVSVQGNE